ncbi:MAG: hypothetical protein Q9163_005486 [Psora crenata]
MPRNSPPARTKRTPVLVFIASALLLWLLYPKARPLKQTDRIPFSHDVVEDYFAHFEGHQDCGITSPDLYTPPKLTPTNGLKQSLFCRNRARLLEAMSSGGRHGFDAPYAPLGCHYRWYAVPEICMILERFDAIVFIGDDMLKAIYSAFNMLLRENIAMGGLKQWEMAESEREGCRCDNQMAKPDCARYMIKTSEEVRESDGGNGHRSPYYCDRSPAPEDVHEKFNKVLDSDPDSYKPIPVIHTLGLSTSLSWPQATDKHSLMSLFALASMDEFLTIADASTRNVPFLWVSPNAAGHLKPPSQILSQGNNALWHYTIEMAKEAKTRELDSLGMYNLTLQAGSWDGSSYGEKVGLVQAMMDLMTLGRADKGYL